MCDLLSDFFFSQECEALFSALYVYFSLAYKSIASGMLVGLHYL